MTGPIGRITTDGADAIYRCRRCTGSVLVARGSSRAAFPLPNELLEGLFASVADQIELDGGDHSLRFTEEWIARNTQSREPLIAWLEENGGYCDCEVVANALDHWEQDK